MEFLKTYLDAFIFGLLGTMSFVMVWFVVERHLFFRRVQLASYARAEALQLALTRRLTTIATIGANAPYIGLLGTVLGILVTFHDIGQGGRIEPGTVMLGLALALKATALGLVVAIPSIVAYNGLVRRTEELTEQWQARQSS
ncbi:MAG TPA: TonB-system energizer ExbB [Gammaproteobacteria bacterium]